MISGIRINVQKSKRYKVGEVDDFVRLAEDLGSEVESFPTLYLGLLLGPEAFMCPLGRGCWGRCLEGCWGGRPNALGVYKSTLNLIPN